MKLLLKGAMANGCSTELWTTRRLGTLIKQHCRVQFHRSHGARLLHELGFSCQRPESRALERDEQRIEEWKRARWPQVKMKALRGWVPTTFLQTNPASWSFPRCAAPGRPSGRLPSFATITVEIGSR